MHKTHKPALISARLDLMADEMGGDNKSQNLKAPEVVSSDEIFKRMVINDKKQNMFLKAKLSKGATGSYGVTTCSGKNSAEKSHGIRFVVVTLGVLSLAMSQMSRSTINYCITSMVDTKTSLQNLPTTTLEDGLSPSSIEVATESLLMTNSHTSQSVAVEALDADQLSTLDPILFYMTTERANQANEISESDTSPLETEAATTTNPVSMETTDLITESSLQKNDKFKWSMKEQSLVKGGFFYTYFVFMIVGGRISEIYGAKYVLLLGVAGSALINLATPWMARNSLVMLIMSRSLMGLLQSGVFPAMYALINKWLTMSEASIFAPMIKMSLRIGGLAASLIPGLVPDWPDVFYIVGYFGVVWSVLWFLLSTSEPSSNRWINKTELDHILKKKRKTVTDAEEGISMTPIKNGSETTSPEKMDKKHSKSSKKTPWLKIITSPSVLGLVFAKFAFNCFNDFVQIELPSYLKFVHEATRQRLSAITTTMFAIQVSLIVLAGWIAKEMIKRKPLGVTKTAVRKIFQSMGNIGTSLLVFMLTLDNCDLGYATVILQLLSVASVFVAGGDTVLPYDLSEEYPATIMAIANSVANLSGITVTALTGYILGDQGENQSRWNDVIVVIAVIDFLGGLLFCLLVKAEPIDFETKKEVSATTSETNVEEAPSYEHAMAREAISQVIQSLDPKEEKSKESDESG